MRTKLFLAVTAAALLSAGAAFATAGTGTAGAATRGILYSFLGKLTAEPSNGDVSITVEGGNRAALRALIGEAATQTFAYGGGTQFLKWSNGVPAVVQAGDLDSGDYVWVHVRAPRGSSLDTIEDTDAVRVGDRGSELNRPTEPLYLFRGKLTAVGSSSISVEVRGGNRRALRLLVGESANQTFTVGDSTIFLLWQGKVPTVIARTDLKVGDPIVVRIRADKGSTLQQVESAAAVKVAEHEPANQS
jgi:hypothetical protein